jgi:hypothetical protein
MYTVPTFRQVMPYKGVDEHIPTGNAGIIVPLGGSNVVILADGSAHKVTSTVGRAVQVDEITNPHTHPVWSMLVAVTLSVEKLKAGAIRVFNIVGNSPVGIDVAMVQATNTRTTRVEAMLKVLVLRQLLIKISIRPVQVLDDQKKVVNFTEAPTDAQNLLDQMNSIWEPQANIVFTLGRTDPALIDGLLAKSQGADIQNPTMSASFQSQKDRAADLTVFLVRRAFDGKDRVSGVTNAKEGFALIGDDRSTTTLAHEAGHFLGALDENGKFSQRYGHRGTDPELLMRDGGAGWKIPFSLVRDFNKR